MSENPVVVMEGSLTADLTPIAFDAANRMNDAVNDWNKEGGDTASLVNLLLDQNRKLVVALGRLETEVGVVSGRITRG
ncbi:hypothetical protein [Arthrobacter sp. MP_2.3]|uniref:hypothetical protein n=1 Tax=Arthrobacter sp. MP_2.3 TaxID=3349633 RepID=UPI0038D3903E